MRIAFVSIVWILIVFSISLVIAQTQECSDEQTILKLSQTTNSHSSLRNQNIYSQRVCYDKIFGGNYIGANPPECTTTNKIIGLSQTTNAHAETKEQTVYTNNVCFGDLICHTINRAENEKCNNNEKVVVSLSQETNAHVALGKSTNYPIQICCLTQQIFPQCNDNYDNDNDGLSDENDPDCRTIPTDPNTYNPNDPSEGNNQCNDNYDNDNDELVDEEDPDCWSNPTNPTTYNPNDPIEGPIAFGVSGAFWANMRDSPISNADLNDLVKLRVSGQSLENKEIKYEIWKVDGGFLWFDQQVASQTSTSGFTTWRAGKKEADNSLAGGDYYFKTFVDSNHFLDSGPLTVSNTEDNSPPVADIISPEDRGIYFKDEVLNFRQNSYDVDDGFSYTWKLGDSVAGSAETTRSGNTVNRENYEFTFSYGATGQKNIELTVIDDRGLPVGGSKDAHSILVVDNQVDTGELNRYILAYIDLPRFGEAYGRIVDFDATSTYAIKEELVNNQITLTCLSGKCPAITAGCLQNVCGINVINDPTESGQQANYNDITFSWIFKRGETNVGEKTALGSSGVLFTNTFPSVGFYTAELTASINPSASTRTEFNVFFDNPSCKLIENQVDVDGVPGSSIGESYWIDQNSFTNSFNDCFRGDGVNQNGLTQTSCCPQSSICDDTLSPKKCKFDSKNKCQDFTTEVECSDNDGHPNIARTELDSILKSQFPGGCSDYYKRYGDSCYEFLNCKCEWRNSECKTASNHYVTDGNQNFDFNNLPNNIQQSCNAQSSPISGECTFDFTYQGNCDTDEFIRRSWTASYENAAASSNDPEYCADGTDSIPCGQIVRLPFFNNFNLIITILSLITIYYFIIKKRIIKSEKPSCLISS